LGTEELAERVARREAHTDPIGTELLDRGGTKILRLADSHGANFTKRSAPGTNRRRAGPDRRSPRRYKRVPETCPYPGTRSHRAAGCRKRPRRGAPRRCPLPAI